MNVDFFQDLSKEADDKGLDYLIVGGNAVNAYGYLRTTIDADLLVKEEDLAHWRAHWEERGYRCIHQTDAFCQFDSVDEKERFPVDLMVVSESTFTKLSSKKQARAIGGVDMDVPDPLHLVALKLHALNSEGRAATGKDLGDIVGLIKACDLDVQSVEFREVIDRYAPESLRSQIIEQVQGDGLAGS